MPRRQFIDRKAATTFSLVHRPQNDPLIDDTEAPSMVFAEKQKQKQKQSKTKQDESIDLSTYSQSSASPPRPNRIKQRDDLEDEFGMSFRKHEGEAAQHGIFFDDTKYDYMQHMRDLGSGGAGAWVESAAPAATPKTKQRLEDALQGLSFEDRKSVGVCSTTSVVAQSLSSDTGQPSLLGRKKTYQDQQDIPDDIAGFQPDMDPRLREVLDALDDEAFVADDDIFAELTHGGQEIDKDEWDRLGEQQMFDDDDDASWHSDDTIKAREPLSNMFTPSVSSMRIDQGHENAQAPVDVQAQPPEDPTEGTWLTEYQKFKTSQADNSSRPSHLERNTPRPFTSTIESSTLFSLKDGRRKKRKGARTSTTNHSMTSSSIARTGQHSLLDERFDRIEEAYAVAEGPREEDELADQASTFSGTSRVSQVSRSSQHSAMSEMSGNSALSSYSRASDVEAPHLIRSDFEGIMDDFLGSHSKVGRAGRRIKRGGPQTAMQQLDEIRSGLGPARYTMGTNTAST